MLTKSWLEGVLMECPPGWEDRTILAYALPRRADVAIPPNITVARDLRTGPGDDPSANTDAYLTRQVTVLNASLAGFRVERRRTFSDSATPIAEIVFSWDSGHGRIQQWLVYLFVPDGSVVSFTATAAADAFAQHEAAFSAALQTLRCDASRFPVNAPKG